MNAAEAARQLSTDGMKVYIYAFNAGTDMAAVTILVEVDGLGRGPATIPMPGASDDDIKVSIEDLRARVDELAA